MYSLLFINNKYGVRNSYCMHLAGSVFALLSLIMLLQTHSALAANVALDTDRTVYSIGMKVVVVGQVLGSFDPSSTAEISMIGPNGNMYHSAALTLGETGGFTHEFIIDGDNSLVGKNTLEVKHKTVSGYVSGSLAFEVRERAAVSIHVKDTYQLGEDVILDGRVSPILPDLQVLIQVFNPANSAWAFKSVPSNAISPDGQFSVELGKLAGSKSIAGVYTVRAFYAASTASTTGTFSVVDSNSSQSDSDPSQSNTSGQSDANSEVEVVEKESSENAEVAKETVVQSEIKNTNEEEQEFTYIVLIKNSEGVTVSLSWARGTLAPNQSLDMVQPWVPDAPGEYIAEIFVWESFDNPMPLSEKIVRTIVVT